MRKGQTIAGLMLAIMMLCGVTVGTTTAQESDEDTADVLAYVFACPADLPDCPPDATDQTVEGLADIVIVATDAETGEVLGTCLNVQCEILIPEGTLIILGPDPSTLPEGYVLEGEPIEMTAVGGGVPQPFKIVLADAAGDTDEPDTTAPDDATDTEEDAAAPAGDEDAGTDSDTPTQLPSTGTGTAQGSPLTGSLATIAALLVAAAALVTRRRPA